MAFFAAWRMIKMKRQNRVKGKTLQNVMGFEKFLNEKPGNVAASGKQYGQQP